MRWGSEDMCKNDAESMIYYSFDSLSIPEENITITHFYVVQQAGGVTSKQLLRSSVLKIEDFYRQFI